MRFSVTTLRGAKGKKRSKFQIFAFGDIAFESSDLELTQNLSFSRVIFLKNEHYLQDIIFSYEISGYTVSGPCEIDLPRGDSATRLVLKADELCKDVDEQYSDYDEYLTTDDWLVRLEDLSGMRASLVVGDSSAVLELLDPIIENEPDFVDVALALKEKIMAYQDEINKKMEEGK